MTKLTSWFVVSAAAVAAFAFPALSWGQADISPLDGYTPGQVLQGSPGGSIPVSSMEVYNPASGQMTINIPLVTVQGRGAVSAPLLVPVTSPVWEAVAVRYQYNCGQYGCTTGYGYIVQTTGWNPFPATVGQGGGSMVMRGSGDYCVNSAAWHQTLTRGTFTAPDGTQTEFIDTATSGAPENQGYSRGTAFVADNGSGAKFVSNSAIVDPTGCGVITGTPSGIMTLSNGSQYTISYGTVTQIEDSNGNITLFGASSITDNLGRTYNIAPGSDSNGSYDAVTYAGFSNATRTIKVRYDYLHNHLYTGQTMKTYGQLWPSIPGPPSSGGPTNLTQNFDPIDIVSEIDLADGTKYQFEYDSYGDVRQIILPLGGVIQYSYSSYFTQTGGNPVTLYMMGQIPSQRSQLLSGNVISQMKFPGGGEIDRYDGNGNLLAKETHTITNTGTLPSYATNYNSYQYNQSSANTYYDSAANGGGVLESQTVSYFQTANCIVNCTTAQTVTTTMGTAVKQTGYSYDQYSNLTEQTDSDWSTSSPGGTLRDIRMTYNTASAYINANILSLPTETKIFDGGNNLYADTQIGYDAAGTNNNGTSISPVTLNGTYHDNNNYSGNATRGNATVSRVCQTASGGSCSAWLNYSYNTFDAAGNLVTAQDANGHSTTISYADNYNDISGQNTDALPTAITNAYGQTQGIAYDYYTGKPVETTDINGVSNAYAFSDPLERLTTVAKAAGTSMFAYRSVNYVSSTSPAEIGVTDDQTIVGDHLMGTVYYLDGFGRLIQTGVNEPGGSAIATQQGYDGAGRISSYTGPFDVTQQGQQGSTIPVTTYTYDGLGRQRTATTVDNAVVTTTYSNNTSTVTDQAGKKTTTTFDGLGRVTNVAEDPSNLNISTAYTWTPTGLLHTVQQGTQNRTFNYDAAGRLSSATQPESGTVSYTYDNVGNLMTVTDARGIVKSLYYDYLNRLNFIYYSSSGTTVGIGYDNGASGVNANNTRGRMTVIGNSYSSTHYTSYDAVGNVLASYQQTGGGQNFTFTYTYNLASQLVTETNPQGRTLTTTYDITGRPTKLTGSLSGNGTTYVSSQTYGYFGLPFSYTRGNNVTHAQSYNIRLQPTESYEAVGNSGNSLLFISCPNWGVNANWNVFDQCPHASSSNDNGTVQSYQEFQGGSGYPQFAKFSQTLGYDGLNRLTSASDTGGWSRTFNYDQWGNPWVTNVTGPATAMPGSNVYNGKNQDTRTGYNYDAAGNLLYLNGNSATYDAENRLTALTATGGASETILYDAVGQRVQKSYGGSSTVYVYDAFGRLAAEYANGTTWSRDYIFDGTGFVVASENASGLCTTCYFGYDHLGSVRIVMDGGGNVVGRHDFLPFGEELLGTAGRTTAGFNVTADVTQKFTGQIRDQESGEDFFNARYFTAGLGRFNSADPGNAGASLGSSQSWNGYGYVLGNPLGLVDPSGMSVVPCKYAGSIACVGNDPDFATSTSPYNLLYLTWVNDWQFLSAPPSCGDCGGNSGTNNPPPAKTGTAQRLACAAKFGNDHSIGALFGGGKVAMFLGGNTASSLLNIGLAVTGNGPAPDPTKLQLSGPALGIPVNDVLRLAGKQTIPQLSSVSGFVRGAALKTVFNAATGPASLTSIAQGGEIALQGGITASEYASGVAVAKFAFDIGTVGYGYFFSCGGGG